MEIDIKKLNKLRKLSSEVINLSLERQKLAKEHDENKKVGEPYFSDAKIGKEYDRKERMAMKKLRGFIPLRCTDYGDEYCLCNQGIIQVLKTISKSK